MNARRANAMLAALVTALRTHNLLAWLVEYAQSGDVDGALREAWKACDDPVLIAKVYGLDVSEESRETSIALVHTSSSDDAPRHLLLEREKHWLDSRWRWFMNYSGQHDFEYSAAGRREKALGRRYRSRAEAARDVRRYTECPTHADLLVRENETDNARRARVLARARARFAV